MSAEQTAATPAVSTHPHLTPFLPHFSSPFCIYQKLPPTRNKYSAKAKS